MSIYSALNSAMSGLSAASRSSQIVSENLANALTPGYTRRVLDLNSPGSGVPGVRIGDVQRLNDPVVISNRRVAEADFGAAKVQADFFERMSDLVGTVDDEMSLASQLSEFESSLIEVVSRPDSQPRLNDLSVKAETLADSISRTAEGLRGLRINADSAINSQVDTVNQALKEIEKLNARIMVVEAGGMDAVSMHDQRDQLIDQVNKIIPVNVVRRDNGQVTLYSTGGVMLLDGKASELSFNPSRDIMPHMTLGNGMLSGLEVNGRLIDTSPEGPLRGGTLTAQFEIRDVTAVEAQEDLDAMARDLIERFQDPALDGTIGVTDAGIFTDDGGVFDASNTVGISNRIELNDLVSLTGSAETWRFRDGLYAAAPGDPGDSSLLQAYSDALNTTRTVSSVGLGTSDLTASTLSANLLSRFAQDNETAARGSAFAATSFNELSQAELALGVDTDAELQNLLLVEKYYAANARVISVVDELMETLLRI
ncbi:MULTISPECIES: flagellar hook-associated protein FlgK [unclassified Leisingera]|uniref:flagellar hook-associated protein FlgK n=1 Tax=unclassified Leisingera TaxID=2614906 RepID=UPI00057D3F12|nr:MULTISPECIES: flagellar hook-associated protein FlgK [unclassified Leisingera]KIC18295.1 flagellar hook protein FlgK [Leisingera sp. ANG-DT]KIC27928.1 flagellar hook protein FlgK [Leisingera sp. ANG-M6]KIC32963.1 flagellar hook protein FlgK [Leisingera sp. ANG-S5]